MNYVRVKLLSGGTYTAGTNWLTQFESQDSFGIPSFAGEILFPETTLGVCAEYAVRFEQATVIPTWIEGSVANPVQVQIDGVRSEYDTAAVRNLEYPEGEYKVAFIRAVGPLIVGGSPIPPPKSENPTSVFSSLYQSGDDPLSGAETPPTSSGGGGGGVPGPP